MSTRNIRRVKRFDIIEEQGIQKLVQKIKYGERIKYFLTIDDMYDEIANMDNILEHNARDRLLYELKQFCANVTKDMIVEYTKNCEECQSMKVKKTKTVAKSTIQNMLQKRAQIDFIRKTFINPETQTGCLMIYEDCSTKFVILKPINDHQDLNEICIHLIEIFAILGPPGILQSSAWSKEIVDQINLLWTDSVLVPGIYSELNQSQEIENLIVNWLEINNSENWQQSLPFVQFQKNLQYNADMKSSPFKEMFGREHRNGSKVQFLNIKTENEMFDFPSQSDDHDHNLEVEIKELPTSDENTLTSCQCTKKCASNTCLCVQSNRSCGYGCHNNELCRNN